MKKGARLLFCALAAVAFLIDIASQAAAEKLEGTALEEHVIAHSPWSGDWTLLAVRVQSGVVTYVFERVDGKFSARITEATTPRAVGPVSGLWVVGDTISLTTSTGARHEFKLNEKGELVSKGTTSYGASVTTVLKPTLKEKN